MLLDKEIDDFYSETSEKDRLKYGLGPLEFERNQELISRYLPAEGGLIFDIGGGPGIYSSWLARQGFEVHLVDPVKKHIDQARKLAEKLKSPFQSHLGEARKLDFENSCADLIILHGPLYHLQEKEERVRALEESLRILKPGGILLAFAISYSASTLVGLIQGVIDQPEFYEMCLKELHTGRHEAPESMPGILPQAYYHKPVELKEEIQSAGFEYEKTLAVEGMIWLDKNYFTSRSQPEKKSKMMELLKRTENDPQLLALSPHLLAIAKKP
jgi:ubiquinone/menaquinone biosynthesis C-methylase UbiE